MGRTARKTKSPYAAANRRNSAHRDTSGDTTIVYQRRRNEHYLPVPLSPDMERVANTVTERMIHELQSQIAQAIEAVHRSPRVSTTPSTDQQATSSEMSSSFVINIEDGSERTIKAEWSTDFQVDGFLFVTANRTTLVRSIALLDSITQLDHMINLPSNQCIYVLHVYGLQTKTSERGQYKQVLCHGNMRIRDGITDTNLQMKLTKYTKDYLPILLEPKIKSVAIRLIHRPPSWYRLSLTTSMNFHAKIVFLQEDNSQIFLFFNYDQGREFAFPFQFVPSRTYFIRVFTVTRQNNTSTASNILIFDRVRFSNHIEFKAYFTKADYYKLYQMAVQYKNTRNRGIHPIKYLYRNKPRSYFDSIFERDNGVMYPYMKDLNGDTCSIINGNIAGLFFSTSLDLRTYQLPLNSYFGEIRLHINALKLFHCNCNLYFVDFYCHYHTHYVTVLLTPMNSQTDIFCRDRLLRLDIYDNPFMFLKLAGNGWHVFADHNVHVEVFYTEKMDIPYLLRHNIGFINKVKPSGRGSSKVLGIPKNKECSICNITKE